MSNGIIENAEELKSLYLRTDITDVAAVQSAAKEISENVYVAGKEKYLEALNSATPANLAKARKYNKMVSDDGIKAIILKNLGWIVMGIFGIWMGLQDWETDATWQSLGFWIGVGIQVYIAVLKSAWDKLTLSGAVVHPALIKTGAVSAHATVKHSDVEFKLKQETARASENIFCNKCGIQNNAEAKFCKNCGAKL